MVILFGSELSGHLRVPPPISERHGAARGVTGCAVQMPECLCLVEDQTRTTSTGCAGSGLHPLLKWS